MTFVNRVGLCVLAIVLIGAGAVSGQASAAVAEETKPVVAVAAPVLDVAKAKAAVEAMEVPAVTATTLKSGSFTVKPTFDKPDDIFVNYKARAKCPKGYQMTGSGLIDNSKSGSIFVIWKDGVENGYWVWAGTLAIDTKEKPKLQLQLRCMK